MSLIYTKSDTTENPIVAHKSGIYNFLAESNNVIQFSRRCRQNQPIISIHSGITPSSRIDFAVRLSLTGLNEMIWIVSLEPLQIVDIFPVLSCCL